MTIQVELVAPLDYLILDLLPVEGSVALGVYPEGALASDVRLKIAEGKLPMSVIATRLRVLGLGGYVVKVRGLGRNVWQRTPRGERELKEWRKRNARSSED